MDKRSGDNSGKSRGIVGLFIKLFNSMGDENPQKARISAAIWLTIAAVGVTLLLGGFVGLISGNFVGGCKAVFFWFAAPLVVSALLILLLHVNVDDLTWLGCGLYYGTFAAQKVVEFLDTGSVGFVLAALVCYIIYRKRNPKE